MAMILNRISIKQRSQSAAQYLGMVNAQKFSRHALYIPLEPAAADTMLGAHAGSYEIAALTWRVAVPHVVGKLLKAV